MTAMSAPLQHQPAFVAEQVFQGRAEPRRQRAVDGAVIVGKGKGLHETRLEFFRPLSQTGCIFDRVRPRIATSGAFTMGVKDVPPMPPRDEMVKDAPDMSSPFSLPSRALADNSPSSLDISTIPLASAFLITGTIRPFGVSAAKPIW